MYNILKRMINQDNYDSIDDIRNKIDVFYAVTPARLNTEQYKELNYMLNAKEITTKSEYTEKAKTELE